MLNNVVLIGRLTADPELIYVGDHAKCTFTLAVDRSFTNAQGERDADFIFITCWRKLAENVSQYCTKGQMVAVKGEIRQERWEKDGQKRSKTGVTADNVRFLERKRDV